MTSIGHFAYASETDLNPSIVTFYLKLAGKVTVEELYDAWKQQNMASQHPRFHQRISDTSQRHFEPEDSETVHLTETTFPKDSKDLHSGIAGAQTKRWSLSDALWYATLATSGEESIICVRGHHSLADGASMGAALLDLTDEADEMREKVKQFLKHRKRKVRSWWQRMLQKLKQLAWLVGGSFSVWCYQGKLAFLSWLKPSPWPLIESLAGKGQKGYRVVSATQAAPLNQVKWLTRMLSDRECKITVNDVFTSCVTAALAKQLEYHQKLVAIRQEARGRNPDNGLTTTEYVNVSIPVHLRGGVVIPGESVGNRLGAMVARLPGQQEISPEERLRFVSEELASVKKTPVAFLSHMAASASSKVLPTSWTSGLFRRSSAGSSCVVTNTRGPPNAVHIRGHRVKEFAGFVPIPPGIPIGIVVSSYENQLSLTLSAHPWAVPDPDLFLKWILEEYIGLVKAAKRRDVSCC